MSNASRIGDYVIGNELFRYVTFSGIWRYVVIGRREYEGETQLEVECQTCSHGWNCRLLLAEDDNGNIRHVHMLNESDDDPQKCWHYNDENLPFRATSEEARRDAFTSALRRAREELRKHQAAVEASQKRVAELEAALEPTT